MAPKKKRPIAKCRFLFEKSTERGWGEIDRSLVQDYGDSNWGADPSFQTKSATPASSHPQRPPTAPPAVSSASSSRARRGGRSQCNLVFRTPSGFEGFTQQECTQLWPNCRTQSVHNGKVSVTLEPGQDVMRALELRSVLSIDVLVGSEINFFPGSKTLQALYDKVRRSAGWLPWSAVLTYWAMLAADRCSYPPDADPALWFPCPTFDICCQTSDGALIKNYDEVSKAFSQGFQQVFKKWTLNPNNPDVKVILEFIGREDLTVLLEIKPAPVVSDPFLSWTPPLKESAIAYGVLSHARAQWGDLLLNVSCSALDVSEEVVQHFGAHVPTVMCDGAATVVRKSLVEAREWCERQSIDGAVCTSWRLPFRENTFDIVIGVLSNKESQGRSPAMFKEALLEMARVCRLGTGRLCLLTDEDPTVEYLIPRRSYWTPQARVPMSFCQFNCTLFVLNRTQRLFQYPEASAAEGVHYGPLRRHRRSSTSPKAPSLHDPPSSRSNRPHVNYYADPEWSPSPSENMDWTASL